jgi:hypothetical protein
MNKNSREKSQVSNVPDDPTENPRQSMSEMFSAFFKAGAKMSHMLNKKPETGDEKESDDSPPAIKPSGDESISEDER